MKYSVFNLNELPTINKLCHPYCGWSAGFTYMDVGKGREQERKLRLRWQAPTVGALGEACTPIATAIKLSFVGAGRARDEDATNLQSLCKGRGHGPLLRNIDMLNLMAVTPNAPWLSN